MNPTSFDVNPVSTVEEVRQRDQDAWAQVPSAIEQLAEQCCDEFHNEGGTFQSLRLDFDRQRWLKFAGFLWGMGARPSGWNTRHGGVK